MFQTKSLHAAGDGMAEMEAQPQLTHHIERHDERILKGLDDLPIDITMSFDIEPIGGRGIENPGCQMQEVKYEEEQEHKAGDGHGAGRQRSLTILADRIGDRAGSTIAQGRLDRQGDVESRKAQQPDPGCPEDDRHIADKRRIAIQRMGSFEYLKISQHVKYNVEHKP